MKEKISNVRLCLNLTDLLLNCWLFTSEVEMDLIEGPDLKTLQVLMEGQEGEEEKENVQHPEGFKPTIFLFLDWHGRLAL